jgi:hypothetical protein
VLSLCLECDFSPFVGVPGALVDAIVVFSDFSLRGFVDADTDSADADAKPDADISTPLCASVRCQCVVLVCFLDHQKLTQR